jgi:large subunit ribosomal protein L29
MKFKELREMSDEQLGLTLKETAEGLFRLRIQAQTERLDAPSELAKSRRLIARIKTLQHERFLKTKPTTPAPAPAPVAVKAAPKAKASEPKKVEAKKPEAKKSEPKKADAKKPAPATAKKK